MSWFDQRVSSRAAGDMSDRVVVLLSKTGSGKSTSIAPNLYLRFFHRYRANIVITQPRQLTAQEIPKDIATIPDYREPNSNGLSIELYRNLGYQTMEVAKKPAEKGILFCTTGILLQFLKNTSEDQFCRRFRVVIVDEAHDRALDVDLILMLMKRLIRSRLNNGALFLILMSATLNVARFTRYFGTRTVFEVSGQTKHVDVVYPPVDVADIYAKTCDIIADIERYEEEHPPPPGVRDVIVFMPAQASIRRMVAALMRLNEGKTGKKVLPVEIAAADVHNVSANMRTVFETDPAKLLLPSGDLAFRRVIVATNVAETGLTLPTLRYCVDSAFHFSKEFIARHGVSIMTAKPTTRGMSTQRKGRVGRKHPGVFFPLYTEETERCLIDDDPPRIETEDFTSHLLAIVVSADVSTLDRLPVWEMPTPPPDDSVRYSLERLFLLGAIDDLGRATELGRMMNTFHKISIESAKMILSGLVFRAPLKELVALDCLLSGYGGGHRGGRFQNEMVAVG
ncbi:hypothetical protein AM587_10003352 [Phytophthora nicotianae]|uniref:P-loop containing nucleoside triphosphate hydrolase protein n=1 Tax=Phytophthora nicotianae TaxID=4792 RepID=A0A0W8D056_PHYNI|nr:hypothetical protein AM587_10003352 [Phytophthora nicotianae]